MNVFKHENIMFSVILIVPSLYLWRRLYKTYISLKKEFEEEKLFYERHNCIIMYSKKCIRGWPPNTIKINTRNLDRFLEPYLYFINTSKHTLEIAVMMLAIKQLLDAIYDAVERGVKVKLIVNFQSVQSMTKEYNKLIKSGVKIGFYIDKSNSFNQIMHSKCMLKDCDDSSGFLCMGSMNFTGLSAILNNFEDVVFTSNIYIVEQFHNNFKECWTMIRRDNNNLYNKTVLVDAGFLQ